MARIRRQTITTAMTSIQMRVPSSPERLVASMPLAARFTRSLADAVVARAYRAMAQVPCGAINRGPPPPVSDACERPIVAPSHAGDPRIAAQQWPIPPPSTNERLSATRRTLHRLRDRADRPHRFFRRVSEPAELA